MGLACLDDYETAAKTKLPKGQFEYYRSGGFDEFTLRENRKAFNRIRVVPRVLRDVYPVDLSTSTLGYKFSLPIGIAPTAYQKMADPVGGEISNARAAGKIGIPFILSFVSNTSIETMAQQVPDTIKIQQILLFKDRELTTRLIRRAEAAGFKGIVLTVDLPTEGVRRSDAKNQFSFPEELTCANIVDEIKPLIEKERDKSLIAIVESILSPRVTWDDVKWLKSVAKVPVILKGILRPDDALNAIECGVDAIIVSNHGARHMNTLPSIEALPGVVEAVNSQIPVIFDSGIRQGPDILKALALGASMVLIGRPTLWGLAVDGEKGVEDVLNILKRELTIAMAFAGCKTIKEIDKSIVAHKSHFSKL